MENENQKPEPKKQLCTITINAVVKSDEEAISLKQHIEHAFDPRTDVQIHFSLANAPRPR